MRAPVDSQLILSALGKGCDDTQLRAAFALATLNNWPDPRDDREGARICAYWRYGCALYFQPSDNHERLYGRAGAQGDLVVESVVFFGDADGYRAFEAELPFGLSFDLTPQQAAAALGAPALTRTPYDRRADLFLLPDYALNVCYDEREQRIDYLQVRWPTIYESGRLAEPRPHWREFERALGHPVDAPAVLSGLSQALNVPVLAEELAQFECDDYRRGFGVSFYSNTVERLHWPDLASQHRNGRQRVLTGVKFQRAGDFASAGFAGPLPFGLWFGDSPEQALAKLPAAPTRHLGGDGGGHYGLLHDGLYHHVQFSLVYASVVAISVFHPALAPEYLDATPD